jgi:monofunctional biosynthetic peptidoglycan transglycosylase
MSRTEAARIAAVLPLPKKRGAVAPKGFTKRYGGTIAARIGAVARDGLDACVYKGITAPKDKSPPASQAPQTIPGEEYESAKALLPVEETQELPASPSEPVDNGLTADTVQQPVPAPGYPAPATDSATSPQEPPPPPANGV